MTGYQTCAKVFVILTMTVEGGGWLSCGSRLILRGNHSLMENMSVGGCARHTALQKDMGRFRASLIECVGARTFNRKDAKVTFIRRMGVPPTKEILDSLEDQFNRESFMIQITKEKRSSVK